VFHVVEFDRLFVQRTSKLIAGIDFNNIHGRKGERVDCFVCSCFVIAEIIIPRPVLCSMITTASTTSS